MNNNSQGPKRSTQSNWTLGWNQGSSTTGNKTQDPLLSPRIKKYHNESQIHMENKQTYGQKKQQIRMNKKKEHQQYFNEKLPTYNPKNGGDDKVDYRNKNQFYSTKQVEKKNYYNKSQINLG